MNKKDNLGDRMKDYENCYRLYLPKKQPIIIRCDMRAGHTFTKGFARPYDKLFAGCMWKTAKQLCKNISGCKIGYTQSDEITLVLTDYENPNTEPWFGNNLQKIVSISASMATHFFHEAMSEAIYDLLYSWSPLDWNNKELMDANKKRILETYNLDVNNKNYDNYIENLQKAHCNRFAFFDSRAFLVPREEVFNVLYWRQLDCVRNSIQLLGQAHFSHKQLQGKNQNEIQEMLFQEKGINWANEPNWFKNGVTIYRKPIEVDNSPNCPFGEPTIRNKWYVDLETPIFTKDRNYIIQHI